MLDFHRFFFFKFKFFSSQWPPVRQSISKVYLVSQVATRRKKNRSFIFSLSRCFLCTGWDGMAASWQERLYTFTHHQLFEYVTRKTSSIIYPNSGNTRLRDTLIFRFFLFMIGQDIFLQSLIFLQNSNVNSIY